MVRRLPRAKVWAGKAHLYQSPGITNFGKIIGRASRPTDMIWPLARRRSLVLDETAIESLVPYQPWLRGLSTVERLHLLTLMADFLTVKTITGARGLEVTDAMRLSIAAQACLPVLNLGLERYGAFSEIVLHPAAFHVRRTVTDEIGLTTEFDDILAGEAIEGGPVVLSWADIAPVAEVQGISALNVVIHEFAHKLDLADGVADGCPPMPRSLSAPFRTALSSAHNAFRSQLNEVESRLPTHVDPDSAEADPWYAELPLDPYAGTDEAEFFAVACEAFFTDNGEFASAFPDLKNCFVAYFRQDPCLRRPL